MYAKPAACCSALSLGSVPAGAGDPDARWPGGAKTGGSACAMKSGC